MQKALTEKIEPLIYTNTLTDCIATDDIVIDAINPNTGLTMCYGRTLAEVQVEHPDARLMHIDEFCARKAERQHSPITWVQTTEERFEEMLNVLPPAAMGGGGFLLGEPWDHDAGNGQPRFDGFRKRGERFEVSSRPMTRAEFRSEMGA